jgi:hypothetical protein
MRRSRPLLLALSIGASACSKPAAPAPQGHPDSHAEPPVAPPKPLIETGVIEGVVRLAAGHELPAYMPEQMEKHVLAQTAAAPLPESCTPPRVADRQPVQQTADGLLTGVVVAASNFSHARPRPPHVQEVAIDDCRLKPSIVVAMTGDTLRVRSNVNYPFMPSYGADLEVRTLIPGQTYEAPLKKPGVSALLCGFTAPCGRTDVIVMKSPLAVVTDAQGKFRIADFPAGETVSLSAWHPLFQESRIDVRVEPGATKQVEFVLTPSAPPPRAAPAPEPVKKSKTAH